MLLILEIISESESSSPNVKNKGETRNFKVISGFWVRKGTNGTNIKFCSPNDLTLYTYSNELKVAKFVWYEKSEKY